MTETTEHFEVAEEGEDYALLRHKEGKAYILKFKAEASSAVIGGEDADTFRFDYETIRDHYPDYSADQILAQLWDQGGYSWMAEPDAS